jgi:predicted lipoprotein
MQSNPANPSRDGSRRRKPVAIWASLGIAVLVFAVFPPVRFHRYRPGGPAAAGGSAGTGTIRPEAAAARFWDERLRPAAQSAADAGAVVAALRADPAAARKQYGRTPALGGPTYFFVAGNGRVVSKGKGEVGLGLDGGAVADAKADVVIETGPLFGNAVRDGTGLLNAGDYPNSGDFNALSAELNKLVKARVLPAVRDRAEVGSRVRFAGVAEVAADATDALPLRLVPVLAEVQ